MASYRNAIQWMVDNDDTDWANDRRHWEDPLVSVTAALVADVFDKPVEQVVADIRRGLTRAGRMQFQQRKKSDADADGWQQNPEAHAAFTKRFG